MSKNTKEQEIPYSYLVDNIKIFLIKKLCLSSSQKCINIAISWVFYIRQIFAKKIPPAIARICAAAGREF